MVDNPKEVPGFQGISSAVYVNMGLHTTQIDALTSLQNNVGPIVVDPVGFGASPYRNEIMTTFFKNYNVSAIKGNANEIAGLSGSAGEGKGVDSAASTEGVIGNAKTLSSAHRCVVSISGDTDVIVGSDGQVCKIYGDVPMLTKITGTGCSLGGIVAAYIGSVGLSAGSEDHFMAACSAHALFTAAGVKARDTPGVVGPGSLEAHFRDALYHLSSNPDEVMDYIKVEML
jgi:hydroxyethylthiazole kinase